MENVGLLTVDLELLDVYQKIYSDVFLVWTVRQVFVRFSDGWSRKGKVQEYNINLADKLEFSCIDYDLSLGSFSLILVRYTKVLIDSELPG